MMRLEFLVVKHMILYEALFWRIVSTESLMILKSSQRVIPMYLLASLIREAVFYLEI